MKRLRMFKPEQIKELLDAQPFRPFRIHMSDGKAFDITNHDAALVGRNSVEVGVGLDQKGFADYFARCAIMHITRIEDIKKKKVRS